MLFHTSIFSFSFLFTPSLFLRLDRGRRWMRSITNVCLTLWTVSSPSPMNVFSCTWRSAWLRWRTRYGFYHVCLHIYCTHTLIITLNTIIIWCLMHSSSTQPQTGIQFSSLGLQQKKKGKLHKILRAIFRNKISFLLANSFLLLLFLFFINLLKNKCNLK